MQREYPDHKHAARVIAGGDAIFFPDIELSELLMSDIDTKDYSFKLLKLKQTLLEKYGIDFIRSENEVAGKGYKIATSTESLRITTNRLSNRIRNAAGRQRSVLGTIQRTKLTEDDSDLYDRHIIKNGLLVSFLNKTPLRKMLPGVAVRVDVPKLISSE